MKLYYITYTVHCITYTALPQCVSLSTNPCKTRVQLMVKTRATSTKTAAQTIGWP